MASVRQIVLENARTFYDFRSQKRRGLWPRYLLILGISFLAAAALRDRSDNLYMSLIAAQSILIGFSFNVMIFLGSNPNIKVAANASIERKQKAAKLNTLSRELFYNLSYFNVISIASVVLCLVMLSAPLIGNVREGVIYLSETRGFTREAVLPAIGWLFWTGKSVILFVLYFLTLDGVTSFLRIVQRSSYYFESKMSLDA